MQKCAVKTAQDKTMTLKKFTTQQKEHYFAPLTHSPKGRRRASNTMCVVTPSGAGVRKGKKILTQYFDINF
ncbi:MAG: hypothetical protein UZ10_BCD003001919 [Bacteroidetes bacterium OLB10]|nr:MAG: hypothetical protein UZ10_BCD003001919 [Bacteroidetes bacterium OLB10]